jgi:phosphoenolpyruvate carboxylase
MTDQAARLFEELVELNFQLYSSLFLTLPLDALVRLSRLSNFFWSTCMVCACEWNSLVEYG